MTRSSPRFASFSPTRLVALALALCLALGGAGLAAADDFEPQFFIESIRVDGARYSSPDLIVAETLLEAGREYGELELQQAVFRVQRLPFVLDATFLIEKGQERGQYVLVIRVEEIKRWFFGEDTVFTVFTNSVAFDNPIAENWVLSPGPLAGIRLFFGRYNVVFGSVAGDRGLQAGYTRYNLFDRRVVASVGLTSDTGGTVRVFSLGLDPTFSSWQNFGDYRQARASLGVPLGGRSSLQLQGSSTYSERGERRNLLGLGPDSRPRGTLLFTDLQQDAAELSWVYDTTDDPVFPSRGLSLTATLDYEQIDAELEARQSTGFLDRAQAIELPPGQSPQLPLFESSQWRLGATLSHHFPVGRRHSLTLSARLAAGTAEVRNLPVLEPRDCPPLDFDCVPNILRLVEEADLDLVESQFVIGFSSDLWGPRRTREQGDLRLENRLEFGYDRTSPTLSAGDNPLYRKGITTSLVFRNAWGLFRFSFQVVDLGRGF